MVLCVVAYVMLIAAPVLPSRLRIDDEGCVVGTWCWRRAGFVCRGAMAVSALLVLAPFGMKRHQQKLDQTLSLLRNVSVEMKYEDWQWRKARLDCSAFLLIWFAIIVSSVSSDYSDEPTVEIVLHACLNAVLAGATTCSAHGMVFVCRSLSLMVDAFCCDVVSALPLAEVAHSWNVAQSVLRRVSDSIETCLLTLGVVLTAVVSCLVVDIVVVGISNELLPAVILGMLISSSILYLFLLSASISEKCARVPSLVNSIDFGSGTERERQRVVDYIASSAAGFYVFGMRLTTGMVLKFMYVCCMVVLGTLTRLAAASNEALNRFS